MINENFSNNHSTVGVKNYKIQIDIVPYKIKIIIHSRKRNGSFMLRK